MSYYSEATVKAPHPQEELSLDSLLQFIRKECYDSRGLQVETPSTIAKVTFGVSNKIGSPMSPTSPGKSASKMLSDIATNVITPIKSNYANKFSMHNTPDQLTMASPGVSQSKVARGLRLYDANLHQVSAIGMNSV